MPMFVFDMFVEFLREPFDDLFTFWFVHHVHLIDPDFISTIRASVRPGFEFSRFYDFTHRFETHIFERLHFFDLIIQKIFHTQLFEIISETKFIIPLTLIL